MAPPELQRPGGVHPALRPGPDAHLRLCYIHAPSNEVTNIEEFAEEDSEWARR